MADDRIRELEIMIRMIGIEIILARRHEGRQEQQKEKKKEVSLDKRMAQQKGHVWSA